MAACSVTNCRFRPRSKPCSKSAANWHRSVCPSSRPAFPKGRDHSRTCNARWLRWQSPNMIHTNINVRQPHSALCDAKRKLFTTPLLQYTRPLSGREPRRTVHTPEHRALLSLLSAIYRHCQQAATGIAATADAPLTCHGEIRHKAEGGRSSRRHLLQLRHRMAAAPKQ